MWQRVLRGLAVAVSGLLVVISATAFAVYHKLEGNIASEDVSGRLGDDRPDEGPTESLDILLIGSDNRAGDNAEYGHADGERSDITLLLHVSADRERASVVSFPRDTIVDLPSCEREDGTTTPAEPKDLANSEPRFNKAFANGGSACTIKLVEQMTDIRVDHHVVIDFSGFIGVIDALGGVEMCIPEPIDDKEAKLKLPAGNQTLDGEQSLGYMRARYSLGNKSDLSRIGRQQDFLAATMRQVTESKLLFDPKRLYGVLNEATKSVTTDPELNSLDTMLEYAESMKGIDPADVEMLTLPVLDNPEEPKPNTLVVKEDEARVLFERLKADEPISGPKKTPTPTATSTEKPLKTPPANIKVKVLNGTGETGRAGAVAGDLQTVGFPAPEVGNADRSDYAETVVRYNPDYDESARTLSAALGGVPMEEDPSLGGTLVVVVGKDYQGTQKVTVAGTTPTPEPTLDTRKATEKVEEGACA